MTKFNQYQVNAWAETIMVINKVTKEQGRTIEQKQATVEIVLENSPFDKETMVNIAMNTSVETHTLEDIIQLMELSIQGVPNGFI